MTTETDWRWFDVTVPERTTSLTVTHLDGAPTPQITVDVYPPDPPTTGPSIVMALVLLVATAVFATRVPLRELAVEGGAVSLGYGMAIRISALAAPLTLREQLAALLGCVLLGGLAGWMLGHLARGLLGGPRVPAKERVRRTRRRPGSNDGAAAAASRRGQEESDGT